VAFSGLFFLHNRQSETLLIGKHLPLDYKDALHFYENWKDYLENQETPQDTTKKDRNNNSKMDLVKAQILNFIEDAVLGISD
jgi:hypothetical protein